MPGATRKGDSAGGVILTGSSDVFIDGMPAATVGDKVAKHSKKGPHKAATLVSGSPDVFVNGKPLVRQGDPASCGHPATGSSTVKVND
jgi:uncharacterized Zn-binding protein involved in type VI secretion